MNLATNWMQQKKDLVTVSEGQQKISQLNSVESERIENRKKR